MFPEQRRQDPFILIGENDDDRHLTGRTTRRFPSSGAQGTIRGPPQRAADQKLLASAARGLVQARNQFRAG